MPPSKAVLRKLLIRQHLWTAAVVKYLFKTINYFDKLKIFFGKLQKSS